jgi:CheY-like chemotaxis protein
MATRALRPPSILLVSNSVDERKVYARSLRAWGYRVVNVATTVLAYQVGTTRPTDMVVTDGHCPGSMTGLELTRRLRIHTRTTTVPIIVLTSVTRRQDGDLSIKAGADMFLERPVSSDVLREHVARLLVASGRLSRYSPPLDLLNFTRKAANRPRPQTTSSFQSGSPASAVPVSRSTGDGEGSVSRSAQAADYRTCPQSWTLGVSAEVASPLRDRTERSSAARAFTLRVWLVLQQRGVRVSRVGRVTGIAVD